MEFGQWVPGLSPHDALGQLGARPGYKEGAKNHHIPLEGLSLPANAAYAGLIPGSGRLPWRRKWLPTPVFLAGKSHGQRSLMGYNPWGCKKSDMTEHTIYIDYHYCHNNQFLTVNGGAGRATQQMLCVSWCPSWGSGPTHPIAWVDPPYHLGSVWRPRVQTGQACRAQAGTAQRRVVHAPRALESGEQVPVSHPLVAPWSGLVTPPVRLSHGKQAAVTTLVGPRVVTRTK